MTVTVNPARLLRARRDAGLTQADVAFRIRQKGHKANERSIRRWESGQHVPHTNVVGALADALGVSIESLFETADAEDDEESDLLWEAAQVLDRAGAHAMADRLRGRARESARQRSSV